MRGLFQRIERTEKVRSLRHSNDLVAYGPVKLRTYLEARVSDVVAELGGHFPLPDCCPSRAWRLTNRLDLEVKPFALLKSADDFEEVPCLRIAVGTEHAHQALGRLLRQPAEFLKSDRGIDVVAQNRLAGVHIPRQQALDTLLEQLLTEGRIALDARLYRFLEVACQRHGFQASRRLRRL